MSDQPELIQPVPAYPAAYDTQGERWLKYGFNTALVVLGVVALAVGIVYVAERKDHSIDTTASAQYTLKPQTLKVIGANKQHVTITSFYTKAKRTDAAYGTATAEADAEADKQVAQQADAVKDLLDEYADQGNHITVEEIDPKLNPVKTADLIESVTNQYGGEIKRYKAFTDSLAAKFAAISERAKAQADQVGPLRRQLPDTDSMEADARFLASVGHIPKALDAAQEGYAKLLTQKPPDYKGVALSVAASMDALSSQMLDRMIGEVKDHRDDPGLPPPLKAYMGQAIPAYQAIKKQCDDLAAEAKGLGELKLDTVREALRDDNSILVRGDTEWKVIHHDQVWLAGGKSAAANSADGSTPKPRFAGEQMITAAILGLDRPHKTKVCFVHSGGQDWSAPGQPLSAIAARLRNYNFDVTAKNLAATGADPAQAMQPPPATPEPTDADVDDAIWVVFGLEQSAQPSPYNPQPQPPAAVLAGRVKDHLLNGHHWENGKRLPGGSAYVMPLAQPQGGVDLNDAIATFGVRVRTDAMAVHAVVPVEGAPPDPDDLLNNAGRVPYIFPINDWGASPITDPMRSLPGVALVATPVQSTDLAGVTVYPLVPIPTAPDAPTSWGTTDVAYVTDPRQVLLPKFNEKTDVPAPLYAAAAAERRDTGARLVVMGSPESLVGSSLSVEDGVVDRPVPDLYYKKNTYVPAVPGDGEFFTNGVFWLAHDQDLIGISPNALSTPRLATMSRRATRVWHVGVLMVGLPLLVLAAGVGAWLSRRD